MMVMIMHKSLFPRTNAATKVMPMLARKIIVAMIRTGLNIYSKSISFSQSGIRGNVN